MSSSSLFPLNLGQIGVVSDDGEVMGVILYADLYNFLINEAEKGLVKSRYELDQRRLADLDGDSVVDDITSRLVRIM
jgi:hypothetical protein